MEAEEHQQTYRHAQQNGADSNENLIATAASQGIQTNLQMSSKMPPLPLPGYPDTGMTLSGDSKRNLIMNGFGAPMVGSNLGGQIVDHRLQQNPVMPQPASNVSQFSRKAELVSKPVAKSVKRSIEQASERTHSPIPALQGNTIMYNPTPSLDKTGYPMPSFEDLVKQDQLLSLGKPIEQDQRPQLNFPLQNQQQKQQQQLGTGTAAATSNKESMLVTNSLTFRNSVRPEENVAYTQGFGHFASPGETFGKASIQEKYGRKDMTKLVKANDPYFTKALGSKELQQNSIRTSNKTHGGNMSSIHSNLKGNGSVSYQQEHQEKGQVGPLHHNVQSRYTCQHAPNDDSSRAQYTSTNYGAYERPSFTSAPTSRATSGAIQKPRVDRTEHRKVMRAPSIPKSVALMDIHQSGPHSAQKNSTNKSDPTTPPHTMALNTLSGYRITSSNERTGQKISRSSHPSRNSDLKRKILRTKFYRLAASLSLEFNECWRMLKQSTTPSKDATISERQVLIALFSEPDVSSNSNMGSIDETLMSVAYNQQNVRNDAGLKKSLNAEFESLYKMGNLCVSKINHYHGRISILDSEYKKVFLTNVATGLKEVTTKIGRMKQQLENTLNDVDRLIKVNLKRKESVDMNIEHGKKKSFVGTELAEDGAVTQRNIQNLHSGSGRKRKRTAKLVDNIEEEVTRKKIQSKKNEEKEPILEENTAGRHFKKAFTAQSRRLARRTNISIDDQSPNRTTNPLLEIAKYPQTSANETLPHGTEFWKMISLYFPRPNTFPISYFGRILGFDLPAIADKAGFTSKEMDPKTMTLKVESQAMTIPRLGKFAPYLSDDSKATFHHKNDFRNRNEILDCVDPMWKAIQKQYRGYNEQMFKAATEMNHSNIISQECIQYARRLGLFGDDLDFRPANISDAESLFQINTDRIRYPSLHSFNQTLKSPGHFIILALDRSKELLGFVHYKFCWYKLEDASSDPVENISQDPYGVGSTAGVLKKDTLWESVLHLENLQTVIGKDVVISEETHKIDVPSLILAALALEHARQFVVYGMVETTFKFVQFFRIFFRMSEINEWSKFLDKPTRFMACDLESCSFRYAFLLMKEKEEASGKRTQNQRTLNHCIIARCYNSSNESNSVKKNKVLLHHGVCNDEELLQNKPVASKIIKLQVDGSRDIKYEQNVSNSKALKHDLTSENLELLRSFSLPAKDTETDKVLIELQDQQSALKVLEDELNPVLRDLFMRVYKERDDHESERATKERVELINAKEGYDAILERVRSEQLAWEKQQEEDDNAVCDICHDGESVPDNRIIFCDSCNVCVHQRCYGVEKVPTEAWYCHACLYFKRDSAEARSERKRYPRIPPKPLPIDCELCPRKQGAFKQTGLDESNGVKWAHVLCAKWQGLCFVEGTKNTIIEDVSSQKVAFRRSGMKCCLCEGMRGTYNKCRVDNCNNWMHVTCARSSGLCNIKHGEDHSGLLLEEEVWSLACPEHSTIEADYIPNGHRTIDQLKEMSKALPDEPMPAPPPKPFHKMSSNERKKYFSDREHEKKFCQKILKRMKGRCEICDKPDDIIFPLSKCDSCGCVAHPQCYLNVDDWKSVKKDGKMIETCGHCLYKESQKSSPDIPPLSCHMCNQKSGTLIKAKAIPMNKKWATKKNQARFKKSLFGHQIWVHPSCGLWHPKNILEVDEKGKFINCTNIIMSNGFSHIEGNQACTLCGIKTQAKVQCSHLKCSVRCHVTCARQAGFEVSQEDTSELLMSLKCFRHVQCHYTLRAILEDMIEIENQRLNSGRGHMTFEYVENLFHWGLQAMKTLGWAWRWAEWWVAFGDNWEPLLEVGQVEENMTKEELRIIDSTPYTRREDAKKCRLAAFGAALRNREYDEVEEGNIALVRALRSILSTQSLVGPLKNSEIDFFTEWLARIYRSNSPQLGYGENQIPVAETWVNDSPVFFKDKSPKYRLGARPLPGMQKLKKGQIFETGILEMDSYFTDDNPPRKESPKKPQQKRTTKNKKSSPSQDLSLDEAKSQNSNPISSPNHGKRSRSKTRSSQMNEETALECLEQMERGPRKKNRTRLEKACTDETLPTNTVNVSTKKVGRPRGRPSNALREAPLIEGDIDMGTNTDNVSTKKVGRPRGRPSSASREAPLIEGDIDMGTNTDNVPTKKVGRPRRRPSNASREAPLIEGDVDISNTKSLRRRRGRQNAELGSEKQGGGKLRSSRDNKQHPENDSDMTTNIHKGIGRAQKKKLAIANQHNSEETPGDIPVAPKRKRGRPPKKKRKTNTSKSEKGSESKARIANNDDLRDTSEDECTPAGPKRSRKKRPRTSHDSNSIDDGINDRSDTSDFPFEGGDVETKPNISISKKRPRRSKSQKRINYDECSSPIEEEEHDDNLERERKRRRKSDKVEETVIKEEHNDDPERERKKRRKPDKVEETVIKDEVPLSRKASDITKTIPKKRGRPPKKKDIPIGQEVSISNNDSALSKVRIPKKQKGRSGIPGGDITAKIPKK